MSISVNYPTPVTVNGFSCKNCTEVDEAKKFIDPAHPQDGPFGIYAPDKVQTSHGPRAVPGGAFDGTSFGSNADPAGYSRPGRSIEIFA